MSNVSERSALERLAYCLKHPDEPHDALRLMAAAILELAEQQKKGFAGIRNILFSRGGR